MNETKVEDTGVTHPLASQASSHLSRNQSLPYKKSSLGKNISGQTYARQGASACLIYSFDMTSEI
jgi:hypothetical protein